MIDTELENALTASMRGWRLALSSGVRRMQDNGIVSDSADPEMIAMVVLAAIQGGLVLSQTERSAWPLEAALDSALAPLHRMSAERAD